MHDEQIPHEAIARQGPKASAIEVHCVYASPLLRDRQGEESKLPPLSLSEEFEEKREMSCSKTSPDLEDLHPCLKIGAEVDYPKETRSKQKRGGSGSENLKWRVQASLHLHFISTIFFACENH